MLKGEKKESRRLTMQQTICFYLTGFGFGHLTRSLAIMEQLLKSRPDIHIIIKADDRLLEKAGQYLAGYQGRFILRSFRSHFSIFFDSVSFCVDRQATRDDICRWIDTLPASAEQETYFLKNNQVQLVVSDIVPEAFEAASQAGVPSMGISNFTWYEICVDVLGEDPALQTLLAMYKKARGMMVYPYSTGQLIPIDHTIAVGAVARPFDQGKVHELRLQYKHSDRPLVFLSVGGSTRVEAVPLRSDMDYLVTMGVDVPQGPNVHRLPADMPDSHNYLAACDLAITKCGWSTVAEATLAKVPMWLMVSKNGWLEERCISAEISNLGIGVKKTFTEMEHLSQTELSDELTRLKAAYSHIPERYTDGMAHIMRIMEFYL
jgi:UDP:flavonoid glycosyltransferase YjiC (YdhE family)